MVDMHVIVYQHADEIDREQWSRLSSNLDIRLDQRWFLLNEADIAAASRYVSLWFEDGSLCALAPCLISSTAGPGFASYRATDVLFAPETIRGPDPPDLDRADVVATERLLRAQPLFPSVAVAAPYSPYAPVSNLLYGSATMPPLFEHMIEAIEELAVDVSAQLWAILGVPANSLLLAQATRYGFLPALVSADTKMQVPWSSFDDYLAALPSRQRSSARRELVRLRERAIDISLEPDSSAIVDDLARISVSHHELHGHTLDRESECTYFREIVRLFGEDFRVIGARRHGELIGFCSLLSNGRSHKGFEYGVDHTKAERSDDLFPNLMYGVIQQIIERGGGSLTFSPTNYKAKLLRGCSLELLWGLYKPTTPSLRDALAEYLPHFNRIQLASFASLKAFQGHLRDGSREEKNS